MIYIDENIVFMKKLRVKQFFPLQGLGRVDRSPTVYHILSVSDKLFTGVESISYIFILHCCWLY